MTPDNETLRKWAEAAGLERDETEYLGVFYDMGDEDHILTESHPALLPLIAERLMEKVIVRDESAMGVAFQHLCALDSDHIDPSLVPAMLRQWLRATAAQRAAAAYAVISSHEDNADD